MKKILIIDDEIHIVELLKFNLENNGYKVDYSYDGFDGYLKTKEFQPDLILLDWMLPNISGIDLLKKIRSDETLEQIPVIMLTAKNMEEDKLEGLEDGADDYITKPFSVKEVLARITSVLRRYKYTSNEKIEVLKADDIQVNVNKHIVTKNGQEIELTLKEFQILKLLIENVRNERKQNKNCLSAQDEANVQEILKEIVSTEFFKHDYDEITSKLLTKNVNYDEAIKSLQIVINSGLFAQS